MVNGVIPLGQSGNIRINKPGTESPSYMGLYGSKLRWILSHQIVT
jgi:hypothetical protein